MIVAVIVLALLCIGLAAWIFVDHGPRYPLRSLYWHFRAPLGHRHHRVIGAGGGVMASCECGYAERALSVAAAEGALHFHLTHTRPWVHMAGKVECPAGEQHRVLTHDEVEAAIVLQDQGEEVGSRIPRQSADDVASGQPVLPQF